MLESGLQGREICDEVDEIEKDSREKWEGLMKEFENERKRLILGINNQSDPEKLGCYARAEIGQLTWFDRSGRTLGTAGQPVTIARGPGENSGADSPLPRATCG